MVLQGITQTLYLHYQSNYAEGKKNWRVTQNKMKFSILLQNGSVITEKTKITISGVETKINTYKQICELIKRDWCKQTQSKSFTSWANELNVSGEYEGKFTKYDALDNLASNYTLNISGNHISLYDFFINNLPFTN